MDKRTNNLYKNLVAQVEKVSRHSRQGSYKIRERYKAAMSRFAAYLAEQHSLQRLANISDEHIRTYVRFMQEQGKSASTIKTDLSAIRYYHDQMPETKNTLSGNDAFELKKRTFGGVDRTWTDEEFKGMVNIATRLSQNRIVAAFILGDTRG